jgi:hypothetical protein
VRRACGRCLDEGEGRERAANGWVAAATSGVEQWGWFCACRFRHGAESEWCLGALSLEVAGRRAADVWRAGPLRADDAEGEDWRRVVCVGLDAAFPASCLRSLGGGDEDVLHGPMAAIAVLGHAPLERRLFHRKGRPGMDPAREVEQGMRREPEDGGDVLVRDDVQSGDGAEEQVRELVEEDREDRGVERRGWVGRVLRHCRNCHERLGERDCRIEHGGEGYEGGRGRGGGEGLEWWEKLVESAWEVVWAGSEDGLEAAIPVVYGDGSVSTWCPRHTGPMLSAPPPSPTPTTPSTVGKAQASVGASLAFAAEDAAEAGSEAKGGGSRTSHDSRSARSSVSKRSSLGETLPDTSSLAVLAIRRRHAPPPASALLLAHAADPGWAVWRPHVRDPHPRSRPLVLSAVHWPGTGAAVLRPAASRVAAKIASSPTEPLEDSVVAALRAWPILRCVRLRHDMSPLDALWTAAALRPDQVPEDGKARAIGVEWRFPLSPLQVLCAFLTSHLSA